MMLYKDEASKNGVESYYAHKLHAALNGLIKTPEIQKTFYPNYKPQQPLPAGVLSAVNQIIAGRFLGGISGIIERWDHQYETSLIKTIEAKIKGTQQKALLAILNRVPTHDPSYIPPSDASLESTSAAAMAATAYAQPPSSNMPELGAIPPLGSSMPYPPQQYGFPQQPPPYGVMAPPPGYPPPATLEDHNSRNWGCR